MRKFRFSIEIPGLGQTSRDFIFPDDVSDDEFEREFQRYIHKFADSVEIIEKRTGEEE